MARQVVSARIGFGLDDATTNLSTSQESCTVIELDPLQGSDYPSILWKKNFKNTTGTSSLIQLTFNIDELLNQLEQ